MMKRFHSDYRTQVLAALILFALAAVAGAVTLPPRTPVNEVSISAQVPTAYAAAGTTGSFLIARVGSGPGEITVHYQVSGKAVAGQDYRALKGTRTMAAGKDQVKITVHPLALAGSGGTVKGVRVTLLEGDGYALGATVKATVKIVQ